MTGKHPLATLAATITLLLAPAAMGMDTDGDGVDDAADNCIEHANADQRDSNGDGFGNRCDADFNGDLITNVVDLGVMRSVFFSANEDADLDGDGMVNFIDLGILRTLFFQAPGPAGPDSNPSSVDPDSPPQLDVTLRIIDGCPFADGSQGHDVTVLWESDDLGTSATINVQALPLSGQPVLAIGSTNPGTANFVLNDPYGGPLQVVVQGESNGIVATGVAYADLVPCIERPIIPPGLGFQDQPQNEPPVIGVPDGEPDEVDVITLGGSTSGPVEPRTIVAAGTGAGFKLFAHEVDFDGDKPIALVEAGPVAGIDVKLHTLEPEANSFSAIYPFVSGYRREGNLWLRSWQLVNDST
ncbi:MAG: thrombospondin type 3 repeat-containing protein, partial [Pseudomonadota bacterium]